MPSTNGMLLVAASIILLLGVCVFQPADASPATTRTRSRSRSVSQPMQGLVRESALVVSGAFTAKRPCTDAAGGDMFVPIQNPPGLVRVNLSSMTERGASLTLPTNPSACVANGTDAVFVLLDTAPSTIATVSTAGANMTVMSNFLLTGPNENTCVHIVSSGTDLFASCIGAGGDESYISRISIGPPLVRPPPTQQIKWYTGMLNVYAITLNPAKSCLFACSFTGPSVCARAEFVPALQLVPPSLTLTDVDYVNDIVHDGAFLFAASFTIPTVVVKIDAPEDGLMSVLETSSLASPLAYARGLALMPAMDATTVFVMCSMTPMIGVRLRKSDLSQVAAHGAALWKENAAVHGAFNVGNSIYAVTDSVPPRVIRWVVGAPVSYELRLEPGTNRLLAQLRSATSAWGTVCGIGFAAATAQGICNLLGWTQPQTAEFLTAAGGSGEVMLSSVVCPPALAGPLVSSCNFVAGPGATPCTHADDVAILCTGMRGVGGQLGVYAGTAAGAAYYLRLVSASTPRLQVRHAHSIADWGTVCINGFTAAAAAKMCQWMGYEDGTFYLVGGGSDAILLENVVCPADAGSLGACTYDAPSNCPHVLDVGLACKEFEYRDYVLGEPLVSRIITGASQSVWDPVNEQLVFASSITPRIYRWDPRTTVSTWLAGDGVVGFAPNATGQLGSYPSGRGITMHVHQTTGAFVGYILSAGTENAIFSVGMTAPFPLGLAAGDPYQVASWQDGIGSAGRLSSPKEMAYHRGARMMLVADSSNNRIRKLVGDPTFPLLNVTTIAGNGTDGSADGDALTTAQLSAPWGVVMLPSSGVAPSAAFITEVSFLRLRRLVPVVTGASAAMLSTVLSLTTVGTHVGRGVPAYEDADGYMTLLLASAAPFPSLRVVHRHTTSLLHAGPWAISLAQGPLGNGNNMRDLTSFNAAHCMPNGTAFLTRANSMTIRVLQRASLFVGTGTRTPTMSERSSKLRR